MEYCCQTTMTYDHKALRETDIIFSAMFKLKNIDIDTTVKTSPSFDLRPSRPIRTVVIEIVCHRKNVIFFMTNAYCTVIV